MSAVDLRFGQPAPTDANLLFGADFVAPRNEITVQAVLPPPLADLRLIPNARLDLYAALPAPTVLALLRPSLPLVLGGATGAVLPGVVLSAELHYFSRTQRPTVGRTTPRWQVARPREEGAAQAQQDGNARPAGWAARWQQGRARPQGIAHRLPPVLVAAPQLRRTNQQQATRLHGATGFAHENATPIAQTRAGVFQNASRLRDATGFRHQDGDRTKRAGRVSPWQTARQLTQCQGSDFQSARPSARGWRGRYQDAVPPPPGISPWIVPRPPTPSPCYTPNAHLLFAALSTSSFNLLFRCGADVPPATVVVPVRRVYIVINDIELRRVDGGENIPAVAGSFTMELDHQSWAWSFSFTTLDLVRPLLVPGSDGLPVELQVMVNGVPYRMRVEQLRRSVRHPRAMLQVQGRSNSALLDAPYAAVRTFSQPAAITAQQLMLDVLTVNGVSNGWALEWRLTDWPIPANMWAHQGTWISAINDIAGSVGGYVQPHDTADVLRILPTWPVRAWELATATPDIELPAGIATVEDTEWPVKPGYNGIYLRGEPGVATYFRNRAGTLGDVLKPMAVHPLLVHADAAAQRAIAELSDSGAQVWHSLELMVLPATGLIKPGKLVRYTDDGAVTRTGIVRSTRVHDDAEARLTQTIQIEARA